MMTATFFIPIFTACYDVIFYKSSPDLLILFTYVTDKTLHLLHVEGSRDKLVGKVQERYGHSKDDAEREVDAWRTEHKY